MSTKKPKLNATQRTLKWLRNRGYTVDVCEKYVAFAHGDQASKFKGGYRKDLFGFMDIIAYKRASLGSLAVQSTSKACMTNHLKKYRRDPEVAEKIRDWLSCGNRFSIIGWEHSMVPKVNGNGFKSKWQMHEMPVGVAMLEPNAADIRAMEKSV